MATGAEVLRIPRTRRAGGWLFVAITLVLITALAITFALTRSDGASTTKPVPTTALVVEPPWAFHGLGDFHRGESVKVGSAETPTTGGGAETPRYGVRGGRS
jgi:hypothetical protein